MLGAADGTAPANQGVQGLWAQHAQEGVGGLLARE